MNSLSVSSQCTQLTVHSRFAMVLTRGGQTRLNFTNEMAEVTLIDLGYCKVESSSAFV